METPLRQPHRKRVENVNVRWVSQVITLAQFVEQREIVTSVQHVLGVMRGSTVKDVPMVTMEILLNLELIVSLVYAAIPWNLE